MLHNITTDLEKVKELASRLPQPARLELFTYLSNLPDSGIRYIPPAPLAPSTPPPSAKEGEQQVNFTWGVRNEEGRVVFSIEGVEIFTATFDAEAYANVFYEKVKTDKAFFRVSDEQKERIFNGIRSKVEELEPGRVITDEEIEQMLPEGLIKFSRQLVKRSLLNASKEISDNLPRAVAMILNRITHGGVLAGGNRLLEILQRPNEKLSPNQIKERLFGLDWQLLKPILGVAPRGGSEPKIDVTDEQCVKLSDEYPGLLSHWQKIEKNSKSEKHWREYAAIDESDTPSDLLNRLDDKLPAQESEGEDYPNIPSALALEHAARRSGIPAGQYSQSRLKNFRQRGDTLKDNSNDSIELSEQPDQKDK